VVWGEVIAALIASAMLFFTVNMDLLLGTRKKK